MKAFLLTFALTLTLQSAISQEYIGLPESGGKWVNAFYYFSGWPPFPGPPGTMSYCTLGIDTLINEINYTRIDTCESGNYKGAFRNFQGKVFYVPKDSSAEYVLYDYSLMPGDSVFNVYYEPYYDGGVGFVDPFMVCLQVDSVLTGGIYRKRVYTYSPNGNDNAWIEGIGQEKALFHEPWANVSGYGHETYCVSINETTIYPVGFMGICDLINSTESHLPPHYDLQIFPNPSNSYFNISLRQTSVQLESGQVRVFDFSGKLLNIELGRDGLSMRIDLKEFPDGIYWIQIELNGQYVGKRIVKI